MGAVAPTVLPHLMPSRPVLSRGGSAWNGIDLHVYRHPPAVIDHPEMEVHSLVIHMAGKVLVQDTSLRFKRVGWADAGCVSLNPPGMRVRREWSGRPEVLLLCLKRTFMETLAEDLGVSGCSIELLPQLAAPDQTLHHLGCLLQSEAIQSGLGSALMVQSTVCSLGIHVLRHYSSLAAPLASTQPTLTTARLKRVID